MSSVRVRLAGSLYVAAMLAFATASAWPIYRSRAFLVLVAVSAVAAALIAAVVTWRRWNGVVVAGLLALAFAFLGVPLAVPGRWTSAPEILRGLGEVGTGLLFGWKDLLTVELPVGSYRNLLVPALVVFLVGTCVALICSWQTTRLAYVAVGVGLAMNVFGTLFGSAATSAPLVIGAFTLDAPVETGVGVGTLVATVVWLAWRELVTRRGRAAAIAARSGLRLRRRADRDHRRGILATIAMVLCAAVLAAAALPLVRGDADRFALRSGFEPPIDLSDVVSPLAQFRSNATDDAADEVIFTVSGESLPDRVRFATLTAYDGETFTVEDDAGTHFTRVPDTLDTSRGEPFDLAVTIGTFDEVWMPTAGELSSVQFAGGQAAALADGFYYDETTRTAIEVTPWSAGDGYEVDGVEPDPGSLLGAQPASSEMPDLGAPQSLRTWVRENVAGSGGTALQGLIDLLRGRGYLSRSLTEGALAWAADLDEYSFIPSVSGHSVARIDEMFTALLEREADAEGSENLVAAVGDDEQFAVAAAMIAQQLGFPARIVIGVRLASDDPNVSTCTGTTCRARDVSAWIEVQTSTGAWVAVDVTPQHTESPDVEVIERQDPQVATDVRPDNAEDVVPPVPDQEDRAAAPEDPPAQASPNTLLPLLQVGGISLVALLVLLGPFAAILIVKAVRRRRRRRAGAPAARISAGWDEYADAVIDSGAGRPASATRRELAVRWATPHADALAEQADAAVFSDGAWDDEQASDFWRMVDGDRRSLSPGVRNRVRAAVSLRSLRAATDVAPRGEPRKPVREGEQARLSPTTAP